MFCCLMHITTINIHVIKLLLVQKEKKNQEQTATCSASGDRLKPRCGFINKSYDPINNEETL